MFHLIALTPSLLFQEQHMTKPLHPAWSLESGFPLSSSRHSRCWCYSASEERPMRGATKPWRVVRMSEMSSSSVGPESGRKSALIRSEEHTSELQSRFDLVCRLLLEKKKKKTKYN